MKEGEIMQKKNQIEFKVSGKYALFTDPFAVSGGEKTSYMIPTYEALKGICKSIYFIHPVADRRMEIFYRQS